MSTKITVRNGESWDFYLEMMEDHSIHLKLKDILANFESAVDEYGRRYVDITIPNELLYLFDPLIKQQILSMREKSLFHGNNMEELMKDFEKDKIHEQQEGSGE